MSGTTRGNRNYFTGFQGNSYSLAAHRNEHSVNLHNWDSLLMCGGGLMSASIWDSVNSLRRQDNEERLALAQSWAALQLHGDIV